MVYETRVRERLSARVDAEPLTPETETKRKNLLFTSCFSILLTVYGVEVTSIPWLDFEVPEGAPNILHGALSIALFYTFVVFALYAMADLRRWFNAGDLLYLGSYFDIGLGTRTHLNAVTQWLGKSLPTEDDRRTSVERMFHSAEKFLTELDSAIATAKRGHRELSVIQWTRLAVIDLGVPLALGVFAMVKIGPSLWPFLSVVLN